MSEDILQPKAGTRARDRADQKRFDFRQISNKKRQYVEPSSDSDDRDTQEDGKDERKRGKSSSNRKTVPRQRRRVHPGDISQEEQVPDQLILNAEITEHILKKLSFRAQKNARLVCKTWNREVCTIFRSTAIAKITEKTRAFLAAFRSRKLPCPFKSFRYEPTCKTDLLQLFSPDLTALSPIRLQLNRYVGFKTVLDDPFYQKKFLEELAPTLVSLETTYWTNIDFNLNKMSFPKLEQLTSITRNCDLRMCRSHGNCPSCLEQKAFFANLILSAPHLKHLNLTGTPAIFAYLQFGDLKKCESLELNNFKMELDAFTTLAATRLTHLKTLRMDYVLLGGNELRVTQGIVAHLSQSLTSLTLGRLLDFKKAPLPLCPHLTHLRFDYFSFNEFNWESVPSLRAISVSALKDLPTVPLLNIFPCVSVRKFEFRGSTLNSLGLFSGPRSPSQLHQLAINRFQELFRAFPNATCWIVPSEANLPFESAAANHGHQIKGTGTRTSCWDGKFIPSEDPEFKLVDERQRQVCSYEYTL